MASAVIDAHLMQVLDLKKNSAPDSLPPALGFLFPIRGQAQIDCERDNFDQDFGRGLSRNAGTVGA
jgi:hypothetical protein